MNMLEQDVAGTQLAMKDRPEVPFQDSEKMSSTQIHRVLDFQEIEDSVCSQSLWRNLYRNSRVFASQRSNKTGSPPCKPTDLSNFVISVPSRRGRSILRHLHSLDAVAGHSVSPIMAHSSHPPILNIWCVIRTLSMGPIIQRVTSFDGLPLALYIPTGWAAHRHLVRTFW